MGGAEGFSDGGEEAEDRFPVVGEDPILELEEGDRPPVDFFEEEFVAPFGSAEREEGAPFSVDPAEHPEEVVGVANPAPGVGGEEFADVGAFANMVDEGGCDLSVGLEGDFCGGGQVSFVECDLCCGAVEPELGEGALEVEGEVFFVDGKPGERRGNCLDEEVCLQLSRRDALWGGEDAVGGHEVVVGGEQVAFHESLFCPQSRPNLILKQHLLKCACLSIIFCRGTMLLCLCFKGVYDSTQRWYSRRVFPCR